MKLHLFLVLTLALSLASLHAGEPALSGKAAVLDLVADYTAAADQFVLKALDEEKATLDAGTLVELRTMEYDLLSFARLGLLAPTNLPVLVFAGAKPRRAEEAVGALLEARLRRVGVDIWADNLEGVTFTLQGDDAFFVGPTNSNTNFPARGDHLGAAAYARSLIKRREFADAIPHLAAAAELPGSTETQRWELELDVTRAWALLLCGRMAEAKAATKTALAREVRHELPPRARVLAHLFQLSDLNLAPNVQATLPRR